MIARTWHGHTVLEKADGYLRYLRTSVLPQLRAIDGFHALQVSRRREGDGFEFTVATLWSSMAAIEEFAGAEPEVAVISPTAEALLSHYDSHVKHAEVVLAEPI